MKNNKQYTLIGLFFLFIQAITIFRNLLSDYNSFFWFCDFVSLPLALCFFFKKEEFVKSIVNIGLVAQLIYIVGVIYAVFSGTSFLNTIPLYSNIFYLLSSILIHLSTSIALFFTYKTKPTINTLFYSLIFLFGMYLVALFFTTPEQGINYVLSSGKLIPWSLVIPHYTQLWVILTFVIVVLPTQLIQYIIWKKSGGNSGQ
jgi:hypothetical protein